MTPAPWRRAVLGQGAVVLEVAATARAHRRHHVVEGGAQPFLIALTWSSDVERMAIGARDDALNGVWAPQPRRGAVESPVDAAPADVRAPVRPGRAGCRRLVGRTSTGLRVACRLVHEPSAGTADRLRTRLAAARAMTSASLGSAPARIAAASAGVSSMSRSVDRRVIDLGRAPRTGCRSGPSIT